MRLLVASVAMVVAVAMLLPAAAPSALAQEASASPSASVEPSASPAPDVVVHLFTSDIPDPAVEWDIAVTGGSPSVDHLTLQDLGGPVGLFGAFTIDVVGQSASLMMTTALPAGWELTTVSCEDTLDPEIIRPPIVEQRSFVLEVVTGHGYSCMATSFLNDIPSPTDLPAATVPPTEALAEHQPNKSSGWLLAFAVLAGIIAVSLLVGVRPRR